MITHTPAFLNIGAIQAALPDEAPVEQGEAEFFLDTAIEHANSGTVGTGLDIPQEPTFIFFAAVELRAEPPVADILDGPDIANARGTVAGNTHTNSEIAPAAGQVLTGTAAAASDVAIPHGIPVAAVSLRSQPLAPSGLPLSLVHAPIELQQTFGHASDEIDDIRVQGGAQNDASKPAPISPVQDGPVSKIRFLSNATEIDQPGSVATTRTGREAHIDNEPVAQPPRPPVLGGPEMAGREIDQVRSTVAQVLAGSAPRLPSDGPASEVEIGSVQHVPVDPDNDYPPPVQNLKSPNTAGLLPVPDGATVRPVERVPGPNGAKPADRIDQPNRAPVVVLETNRATQQMHQVPQRSVQELDVISRDTTPANGVTPEGRKQVFSIRPTVADSIQIPLADAELPSKQWEPIPRPASPTSHLSAAAQPTFDPQPSAAVPDKGALNNSVLPPQFAETETGGLPALSQPTAEPANSAARPLSAPVPLPAQQSINLIAQASRTLGDRPVELTLNPEELGRVRMTLQASDAAMSVVIAVERAETLDLLRRHIDQLASQLREAGYQKLTFEFADDSQRFSNGPGSEKPDTSGEDQFDTPPDAEPQKTPLRLRISADSGIDIRL